jgi:hypothetical protein
MSENELEPTPPENETALTQPDALIRGSLAQVAEIVQVVGGVAVPVAAYYGSKHGSTPPPPPPPEPPQVILPPGVAERD